MAAVRLVAVCVVAHCGSMLSAHALAAAYTEHPTARCDVTCTHSPFGHVATRRSCVSVYVTQHVCQADVHALTTPLRLHRRFRLPQCSSLQHAQRQQLRKEPSSIKTIVPDRAPAGCPHTHCERDVIYLRSRSSHASACLHAGSQETLAAAHALCSTLVTLRH